MKLSSAFGLLLGVLIVGSTQAQTGTLLHELAGAEWVSLDQARGFLATAAEIVPPEQASLVSEAQLVELGYRIASRRNTVSDVIGQDARVQKATKGEVSLLAMQFYGLRGDLRYELIPSTGAAFRFLQDRQFFKPWEQTGQPISGQDVIDLVHRLHDTSLSDARR